MLLLIGAGLGGAILLFLLLRPAAQVMNTEELQRARRDGVLRVGVQENVAGFSQRGDGYEIALARAISRQMLPELDPDVVLEFVSVNEYTALARLDNEEIDLTLSLQLPPASAKYAYSSPYYTDTVYVLCKPENMTRPVADITIGVVRESAGYRAFSDYGRQNEDAALKAVVYASYPDLQNALLYNKVDFIAVPGVYMEQLHTADTVIHPTRLGTVDYVAVSAASTPAFAWLADIVIQQLADDGTLNALAAQYGVNTHRVQE